MVGDAHNTLALLAQIAADVPWWIWLVFAAVFNAIIVYKIAKVFLILNDYKSNSDRITNIESILVQVKANQEVLERKVIENIEKAMRDIDYRLTTTLEGMTGESHVSYVVEQAIIRIRQQSDIIYQSIEDRIAADIATALASLPQSPPGTESEIQP